MLSQYEIDALLGAAADAPPDLPEAGGGPPPALSAVGRSVKTYDFRRPDKFSKDQLRTLQAIHENVARVAAARLSARLRTAVSITLADTAQMVYDEYVQGLTLPTELVVLNNDELRGPFLMDLDLGLALAGVERMLGGTGRVPEIRREPTPIESSLVDRIVDDLIVSIAEGWAHISKLTLRVGETAFGPSLLRVAAPSHVVAVLTYEVRLTGQIGAAHAVLPARLARSADAATVGVGLVLAARPVIGRRRGPGAAQRRPARRGYPRHGRARLGRTVGRGPDGPPARRHDPLRGAGSRPGPPVGHGSGTGLGAARACG